MWREIAAQGFTGTRSLVGKWVRQHYTTNRSSAKETPARKPKVKIPGSRELSWLLIRHSDELEENEKQLVTVLVQDERLAELRRLTHKFMQMVRHGLSEKWSSWLESCCESAVKELKNFALGLKKDVDAVYEAIHQPWSNELTA